MVIKINTTKATRCNISITSWCWLKYPANTIATKVCRHTITQTPIEKKMPLDAPSFKLTLAAIMLSKPGGITPTKAIINAVKKMKVIFKFI